MAYQLKKLSPVHKEVASLLAQGLPRGEIARICSITPEYVTMLAQQPIVQAWFKQLTQYNDLRMQALHEKAIDSIAIAMEAGNVGERLQGAKMVLRSIGKEGTVQVGGTVQHQHSLLGLLQTLPPPGTPTVPNGNTPASNEKVIPGELVSDAA